jgi:hypothetical protein
MLLAPVSLHASELEIVGAEQLHAVLVGMLEQVGQRRGLVEQDTTT